MKKYVYALLSFLVFVFIDQYTKYLAVVHLKGNEGIPVIKNVFQLLYLENFGAAFGIMQNQRIFLLLITTVMLIGFIFLFIRIPGQKRYILLDSVLILLASGAVGNMIDRLVNGYVIDFLYFELINFPIFNIADCYVVISAILGFLLIMFYYKDEELELILPKKKKTTKVTDNQNTL